MLWLLTAYILYSCFFFLMIRRPPRSTLDRWSAASNVYKRQDTSRRSARIDSEYSWNTTTPLPYRTTPVSTRPGFTDERQALTCLHTHEPARMSVNGQKKIASDSLSEWGKAAPETGRSHAIDSLHNHLLLSVCLLYTSPSPRDRPRYRMPSSA